MHSGAHLGDGVLDGNSLKCRFHGWEYDGAHSCREPDGAWRALPDAFAVAESAGLIWLFQGRRTPFPLPGASYASDEYWSYSSRIGSLNQPCYVQIANALDLNHLQYVHGVTDSLPRLDDVKVTDEAIRWSYPLSPSLRLHGAVCAPNIYMTSILENNEVVVHGVVANSPRRNGSAMFVSYWIPRPRVNDEAQSRALFVSYIRDARATLQEDQRVFRRLDYELTAPTPEDRVVAGFLSWMEAFRVE